MRVLEFLGRAGVDCPGRTIGNLQRFFLFILLAALASCAGAPENVVGVDNPATPAAGVRGVTVQTIYLATSRARSSDPNELFTGERNLEGAQYAKVDVYIPPNHKAGNVERATSVPPDPKTDFIILDPVIFADKKEFQADLNQAFARRPVDSRESFLFVHGFNTDFVGSVVRGAQIAHDSGFKGIPVVFSWASRGKTLQYVYDLNSALMARDDLLEGALAVADTRTTGLSVIAHSMGNLLTVEAMRQAQLLGKFNSSHKLKNILLASPDIDADLFVKQLKSFTRAERRFYVLISADDKALSISRKIAGGVDRVGDKEAGELSKLGVTVIDLSKIDDSSSLNHTKFADSPEIVRLIGRRINEGDSLGDRKTGLLTNIPTAANVLTGAGGSGILVFN